ncbi:MAG: S8 family serine peptidase [Actinomycetota bacterium]
MKRALLLLAVAGSLGLTACQGTKAPAPVYICDAGTPAQGVTPATTPPPADQPLAPEAAGEIAKDEVATADVRTPDGRVPLVTVEETGGAPAITSTPVANEAEAEAVAEQAAADGNLLAVEADSLVEADTTDPLYPNQYAFQNIAFEATWNAFGGIASVGAGAGKTVAVLDTGVQATHEDLNDGQVLAGFVVGQPMPATNDPNGHGTRVAGIIAATTNGAAPVGVAGAAPAAQILPVKVLNENGQGFSSNVASGITQAADAGAKVINLSLGGPNPSSAMRQAVQYAVFTAGVPVISSSGNDGKCGAPSYPGAFPEVMAVGATDQNNLSASFSTTGPYVSISAPGVGIASTTIPNNYAPPAQLGSGTSFSAPYVAAVAAIVRATHPGAFASDVYGHLVATATDLGAPGWDPHFGWGLVNVFKAATT